MFISNNRTSFHLWWKENLVEHPKVSKDYETDFRFCYQSKEKVLARKYEQEKIKIENLIDDDLEKSSSDESNNDSNN